jgi:enhancing lycopene biosynthesis protein 2
MKKFAVVLSGCGVFDGTEITEAIMTMLAIKKNGGKYFIFAPDVDQYHVLNHLTGKPSHEKRNVLVESARIARGKIQPLSTFRADEFDAIVFPGGFGAAKNLSTWAVDGDDATVNKDVENAVAAMLAAGKPIGAMCIAPVILGKLIPETVLTTGNDKPSADYIRKMGSDYEKTTHGEVTIDRENKVFSTPCYMLDATIVQIADGTDNLIKEMMKGM